MLQGHFVFLYQYGIAIDQIQTLCFCGNEILSEVIKEWDGYEQVLQNG